MDMQTGLELEKELQSALDLTDNDKKSDEKELYTECIDNFSVISVSTIFSSKS